MAIKYDIYQNVNTQDTKYPKHLTRPGKNGSVIRRQLEGIALLTHSTAITRLRKLDAKGVIHNISGAPKHPVYELTKK